ncbi:MAG: HAD-IA family hydrolase [Deltaproteobacteria bacterium]|nr:HAD-IA family hydrolase [Deltaproteobacteria bacterium]
MRAVLFDAGNTLIHSRVSIGDSYARVARTHGVQAQADALDRSFAEAFTRRKEFFVGSVSNPHSPARERAWWRGLVADAFRAVGLWGVLEPVFDRVFEDLYALFERPEAWEVFPDVEPCLQGLEARGIPGAIVSNWDSRLHKVLSGLRLHERFRFVLTSAEFGAEKPDPSIFLEAARRLGAPPAEVLHVGDLLVDDIEGSRAAGMRGLLIDRECTVPPIADRICRLDELLERI